MPANQVSGAVGYLVGSATALAPSIGPQQAPAGSCQVRRVSPPPGHVTDTVLAPNETFLTLGNEGVVAIASIVV